MRRALLQLSDLLAGGRGARGGWVAAAAAFLDRAVDKKKS